MAGKVDIVALGELLIDFTEAGFSANGQKLFEQNPGGAPANLLTVASHFGFQTAFIGKIGKDMQGEFLKKSLQSEQIDTRALVEDENYFTTLAFVELDKNGERKFSFARKPGADTQLRKDELDRELLQHCKIFHFGSLSLTEEPSRSATLEALKEAKRHGALISYDPNYRARLWENEKTAVASMQSVIPVVDVVETLRHLTDAGSETVSRIDYKLVQTPQVFDVELLQQAYAQEFTPFFTDDASVVEAMGMPVYLAEGNRENIKITTPFDLKVGSALL